MSEGPDVRAVTPSDAKPRRIDERQWPGGGASFRRMWREPRPPGG